MYCAHSGCFKSLTVEKKGCSLISDTGLLMPSPDPHPMRKSGSRFISCIIITNGSHHMTVT